MSRMGNGHCIAPIARNLNTRKKWLISHRFEDGSGGASDGNAPFGLGSWTVRVPRDLCRGPESEHLTQPNRQHPNWT